MEVNAPIGARGKSCPILVFRFFLDALEILPILTAESNLFPVNA